MEKFGNETKISRKNPIAIFLLEKVIKFVLGKGKPKSFSKKNILKVFQFFYSKYSCCN